MAWKSLAVIVAFLSLAGCAPPPPQPGDLSGTISISGAADLSGVEVSVSGGDYAATAVTGADGRWRLDDMAPGPYRVRITVPNTKERELETSVFVDGPTSMKTSKFTGLGFIRGLIRQSEGCRDNVRIQPVQHPNLGFTVSPTGIGVTDIVFESVRMPAGEQDLQLQGEASGQSVVLPGVVIPYGASVDVGDIQLGPPTGGTATIKGVVSVSCRDTRLAPFAPVFLQGVCPRTVMTDAEGRYEFKNVPHGYFLVKSDSRGAYRPMEGVQGSIKAGETLTVDFTFNGWGEAEGIARYADGRADNSGIRVGFESLPYGLRTRAVTDPDGHYVVPMLCGRGLVYLLQDTTWNTSVIVDVPFNGRGTANLVLVAH